jgi:hypothetical protein
MSQIIYGQSLPSFDQIVKGNVNIKKLSKYRYRITFSKIGKFLLYQVWDKDNVNKMNAKRQVGYVSAKEWVKSFNERNSNNFLDVKTLFTPTAIMETENRVYAFVIHTVDLNSCDKVVFTVSTEEISLQNNTSKKLVQLPLGKCNHVRFDIDAWFDDLATLAECVCEGCPPCSPEKARSKLVEPPYMWYDFATPIINYTLLRQIYQNKQPIDMSDDEGKEYVRDMIKYAKSYSLYCTTLMGVDDCGTKENYSTEGTPVYQRFVSIMKAADFTTCINGETFDPRCTKGCRRTGSDPILDPGSCA